MNDTTTSTVSPTSTADHSSTTEVDAMITQSKEQKANRIVKGYLVGAVVVGLIPMPVVNTAAVTAVQLKMLHSLAKAYSQPFSKQLGKSIIASLVGAGLQGPLSQSISFIPGYGQVAAAVARPVLGGALTYAIGKVFIQHFESGGTFLSFNPRAVKEYFAQELKCGETLAHGCAGVRP